MLEIVVKTFIASLIGGGLLGIITKTVFQGITKKDPKLPLVGSIGIGFAGSFLTGGLYCIITLNNIINEMSKNILMSLSPGNSNMINDKIASCLVTSVVLGIVFAIVAVFAVCYVMAKKEEPKLA